MKKPLLFILVFFVFVCASNVIAADLTYTCNDAECQLSSAAPLFSASNLSPGETVSKSVKLINESGINKKFALKVTNYSSSGGLDKNIQLVITKNKDSSIIWNDNFLNFKEAGEVVLAEITSHSEEDFNLTATFVKTADNNYQGKSVNFDLDFGYIKEEEISTPTPSPSSSDSDDNSNGDSTNTSTQSTTETTAGIITTWAAATYRGLFDQLATDNEILGIQAATPSSDNSDLPLVSGAKCLVSWWWLALVLCYIIASRRLRRRYKKKLFKELLIAQVILLLIFVFLTIKFFCWWILIFISVICGLVDLYRLARLND